MLSVPEVVVKQHNDVLKHLFHAKLLKGGVSN